MGTIINIREALAGLEHAGFVPVIRASTAEKAIAAGRALAAGGCKALEVAFSTPDAARAISVLVSEGVFVGAGTVLRCEQAREAWSAGASFVVSPGLIPELLEQNRLVIPGALTPTEVLAAHRAGAAIIKIFPAETVGGARYLKLLRDPLPFLRFFPTGGVCLGDLPAYLSAGAVAVGVGTALAPSSAIESGDTEFLRTQASAWARALQELNTMTSCK